MKRTRALGLVAAFPSDNTTPVSQVSSPVSMVAPIVTLGVPIQLNTNTSPILIGLSPVDITPIATPVSSSDSWLGLNQPIPPQSSPAIPTATTAVNNTLSSPSTPLATPVSSSLVPQTVLNIPVILGLLVSAGIAWHFFTRKK